MKEDPNKWKTFHVHGLKDNTVKVFTKIQRQFNGKWTVFSTDDAGTNWGYSVKEKNFNIQATLSKINSEWIIDINVQWKP